MNINDLKREIQKGRDREEELSSLDEVIEILQSVVGKMGYRIIFKQVDVELNGKDILIHGN